MDQASSDAYNQVAEEAALYALGLLEGKERKRFESRLRAGCPICGTEVAACVAGLTDAVAAATVDPVAPPPSLRDRLMRSVSGVKETGRDMQVVRHGSDGWIAGPIAGSHFKALNGRKTFLLRLEPGVTFPGHDHEDGAEQCLVLEGSAEAAGVSIHPGDFVRMPQGSFHQELYSECGCVLLISYA